MKHTEGFLKLVDDAKSRVREVDVAQALERVARGARLPVKTAFAAPGGACTAR